MSITVTPDKEYAAEIRHKLKDNGGYCPCSLVKNEDTKCMCKEFREMEEGMCHCGLYIKTKDKPEFENAEHCVCCGEVIPEGRMICPACGK